ncbi:hypothetical protein GCM10007094_41420 [Pseudovibrio japonicus]|uniref:ATP-grasp domain-containing protein n=1 Tax=Pseudovibrio japonicus TaxID=366534 RepID=A0ABQ3EN18_9HYPH|nr:ATP-grasp domain-containing protein [Pseudovibrio japonicus]GHB47829.1 hypothetical protein GCM10007094_41420 [Pseudovibrio japonicus]
MGTRRLNPSPFAHIKVIVTCVRYRIAHAVMKSLSEAGARVIAGDCIDRPIGRYSNYCDQYFKYSDPFDDPEKFVQAIIAKAKSSGASLIVPTFTETQIIARYQDRLLKEGVRMILSPSELIQYADDKAAITKHAQKLGLKVPPSWYPKSISDVHLLQAELPYPVIIKSKGGKAGEGQRIVQNSEQLIPAYLDLVDELMPSEETFPFVQQLVKGMNIGAAFIFFNGRQQASYSFEVGRTFRRVHSIDRRSVRHKKAIEDGRCLLEDLNWHGVAQLDYILDAETGVPYLLEINPRFWGSVSNAIEAGVDFPKVLLQLDQGDVSPISRPQKDGIRSIWFYPYLLSASQSLFSGRFREFYAHLFNPFSSHIRFDDLSISDLKPTLYEPVLGLLNVLRTGGLALDTRKEKGGPWL